MTGKSSETKRISLSRGEVTLIKPQLTRGSITKLGSDIMDIDNKTSVMDLADIMKIH